MAQEIQGQTNGPAPRLVSVLTDDNGRVVLSPGGLPVRVYAIPVDDSGAIVDGKPGYLWDPINSVWVKQIANVDGQNQIAGHVTGTNSNRVGEVDPVSAHHVLEDLLDGTDVAAATNYYPSTLGGSMAGFSDYSLTGILTDADNTLTLTLEVSNDEDASAANWAPAYFYDDAADVNVMEKKITNGSVLLALSLNSNKFKLYRWKLVIGGATNTIVLKGRKIY